MMNTRKLSLLAASTALFCTLAPFGIAQTASTSTSDKLFLKEADEGNSAEIAASKMALKKSHDADVKAYAQRMITDHEKLRSDMASFDQQMGVKTPQPLNEEHQAVAKKLQGLSGKDFDKAYVEAMDKDHHKTLAKFQNEIATTQNTELKTAVQQGATTIQQHTDMADQLAQKMNLPVATATGQ